MRAKLHTVLFAIRRVKDELGNPVEEPRITIPSDVQRSITSLWFTTSDGMKCSKLQF